MLKYAETVEKTLQVGITGDIVFTVEDSWEFFCEYIYIYVHVGNPLVLYRYIHILMDISEE
jgi:hypothetical protein